MKRIVECLLIVFFSTLFAMTYNHFSPNGIALIGEWNTDKGVVSAGAKNKPVIHEIEIGDILAVKGIFDDGGTIFLDARSEDAFNEGHITGATSFPVFMFEEKIESFYQTTPPSTPVITYCSGRECQDSHELAQLLMDIGYSEVHVFIDGYPAWLDMGFPVEAINGGGE